MFKALRYYDEIGLLEPSAVDSSTGYRYYLAEQLPRLNRILALKDLGFSLEAIAVLLDDGSFARGMTSGPDELTRDRIYVSPSPAGGEGDFNQALETTSTRNHQRLSPGRRSAGRRSAVQMPPPGMSAMRPAR